MSFYLNVEIPVVSTGRLPRAKTTQILCGQISRHIEIDDVSDDDAPLTATLRGGAVRVFDGRCYGQISEPLQVYETWTIDPCQTTFFRFTDHLKYDDIYKMLVKTHGDNRVVDLVGSVNERANLETARLQDLDLELIKDQLTAFEINISTVIMTSTGLFMQVKEPILALNGNAFRSSFSLLMLRTRDDLLRCFQRREVIGFYGLDGLDAAMTRSKRLRRKDNAHLGPINPHFVKIHRSGLLTESFLIENAALFAVYIRDDFFGRLPSSGSAMLHGLLSFGMERLQQIDRLCLVLDLYREKKQPQDLVDIVANLLDLADNDPFWRGTKIPAEQRNFMRACLDNEPVHLELSRFP